MKKTNRIALITGGSSGLGAEFAKQLALKGYELILLGRNKVRLDQVVSELQKINIPVIGFQADITDEVELKNVTDYLDVHEKKINFLILNAGVGYTNTVISADINNMKNELTINLWGTILSTKIFLPYLEPKASILFISSAFGLIGSAGYACYCASKAGIINFALAIRRELLNKVNVYVACPADIDTPQHQEELQTLPKWLKISAIRGKALPVDIAAERILRKCKGSRFIIIINFYVYLFVSLLPRFLPSALVIWLGDRVLPTPK